jgi:AmpE protein
MAFLTLLIALALLQYWGSASPFHRDGWFHALCKELDTSGGLKKYPGWAFWGAVVLPTLLVLVLVYWLQGLFFGLLWLLLAVVLLMFSLGRGQFNQRIDEYLSAWRSGDAEAAYWRLQGLQHYSARPIAHAGELHAAARSTLFYRSFERLFAVLFWFMLAGPAAALFYRLVFLYRFEVKTADAVNREIAGQVLYWLEWLPVRLLGLTYSVMGNYMKGLQSWQSTLMNRNMGSAQVLNDNGLAALDMDMYCQALGDFESELKKNRFMDLAEIEIKNIQALITRSLVTWVVIIALVQFF